jgi:type IV secretory pathway TraG/TraD family ATPase VirD4
MFVIHNQGQVIEIYGKHQAKTILGAGIRLLGSTNNYDDLEDFSKGLGDTIRTEYVGQAHNAQRKEERRPLMSPDQIARLHKDQWLVLITGLFPLQLQKGYWFKDRKLKKLLPKNLKPPI